MAEKEEFKDRLAEYNMDDDDENINWNDKGDVEDWFSFDFTLAELKTLRKKQSSEERDPRYDWKETVVTLDELVEITKYVVGEQELSSHDIAGSTERSRGGPSGSILSLNIPTQ